MENIGDYRHNSDLNSRIHSLLDNIQTAEIKVFQLDNLIMQKLNKNDTIDPQFIGAGHGNKMSSAPKDIPENKSVFNAKQDSRSEESSSANHHERYNCRRRHTMAMPIKEIERDKLEGRAYQKYSDESTQTHTLYLEKRCPFCGRDVLDAIYRVATRDIKKLAKKRQQRLLAELAEKEGRTNKKGTIFRFSRRKSLGPSDELSLKNFMSCSYDASNSRQYRIKDETARASRTNKTPRLKSTPSKKSRKDNEISKPDLSKMSKHPPQKSESQLEVKVKKEAQKIIATMLEEFVKQLGKKEKDKKKDPPPIKKSRRKKNRRPSSPEESATTVATTDKENTTPTTSGTTTTSTPTSSYSDDNETSGKEDTRENLRISTVSIAAQTSLYYEDDGTPLSERESVH